MFAGLRIGELTALRWRDVDLATGWLRVGESKTDAGRRRVKIRGGLREELLNVRMARKDTGPDDYVFATTTGRQPSRENIRNRVLSRAVEEASKQLVKDGSPPLPERLAPHSAAADVRLDPQRHRRGPRRRYRRNGPRQPGPCAPRLRAVNAPRRRRKDLSAEPPQRNQLAAIGRQGDKDRTTASDESDARLTKTPDSQARPAGFEPATSRSGGETLSTELRARDGVTAQRRCAGA